MKILLLGSGGAGFQGPFHPVQPEWSAFREQEWGWSSLRFVNETLAQFAFTAYNASVHHAFELTRSSPPQRA